MKYFKQNVTRLEMILSILTPLCVHLIMRH